MSKNMPTRVRYSVLFAILLLAACVSQPRVAVEKLPRYDALFEGQTGWIGADGAYSVALTDDEILWLFGDTFFGSSLLRKDRHIYIYGTTEEVQDQLRRKSMILAQ